VIFVRDIQSGRFDWKSSVYVSRRKASELNPTVRPWRRADHQDGDRLALPLCTLEDSIRCNYGGYHQNSLSEQLAVPEWLALYINSSHVTRQIRRLAAGVTRQKLTLADFRGVTVSLPTVQDQLSTMTRVSAIDRLVSSEEDELRKLQETKDGLLADLLRDASISREGCVMNPGAEYTEVETPLLNQLAGLGWQVIEGLSRTRVTGRIRSVAPS